MTRWWTARKLPEITFVLVVRPDSLIGQEIPENVKTMVNLPFEQAMNIMLHSAFTVIPLSGAYSAMRSCDTRMRDASCQGGRCNGLEGDIRLRAVRS